MPLPPDGPPWAGPSTLRLGPVLVSMMGMPGATVAVAVAAVSRFSRQPVIGRLSGRPPEAPGSWELARCPRRGPGRPGGAGSRCTGPGGERRVVAAIPGRAAAAGPGLPAVLSLAGRAVRLPASAGGLTGNMVKAT